MVLMLAACGAPLKSAKYTYIDQEFVKYVELFENRYKMSVHATIVFKDIVDEDVAGQCTYSYPRLIEIDTPYWLDIDEYGREQLVLHELGHCILNLDHDETIGTVGAWTNVPMSIMYPIHFGSEPWYRDNREYYLQELAP